MIEMCKKRTEKTGETSSTMERSILCIGCPLGCRLTVVLDDGSVVRVSGNACKRGDAYARQEAVQPLRRLTGTMRAAGCNRPFSVITDKPVPKELLLACAAELKRHAPEPPIQFGDVVLTNILGTGCQVIATQDCQLPFKSK